MTSLPKCRNCGWELEWCKRCEEYYCPDCDGGHSGCEYNDDEFIGEYDGLEDDEDIFAKA